MLPIQLTIGFGSFKFGRASTATNIIGQITNKNNARKHC